MFNRFKLSAVVFFSGAFLTCGVALAQTVTPVGTSVSCLENANVGQHQFACGTLSVATGLNSTAVGFNAVAPLQAGTAFGASASSAGTNGAAVGFQIFAGGIAPRSVLRAQ